jgi:hypothetical protein
MNEEELEQELVEEKRSGLSIIGQIFRVLFYLGLIYLVWRFFPFSFEDIDFTLKGILKTVGSVLLMLSIIYALLSPQKDDYENWGWFAIWLILGITALYGLSFLL